MHGMLGLIIEKILFTRTRLSSLWGGGWNKDTFGYEFQCSRLKVYFRTAQSIVQVTHSHNPFSLRRIPFNYSFMSNNIMELRGNFQIHVLFFANNPYL